MRFDEVFSAVAHKRLSRVDFADLGSNQHEINGSAALRELFGTAGRTDGSLLWSRFADEVEPSSEAQPFTFYDARARSAERTGRSEWRLYYAGDPMAGFRPGDLLVLAQSADQIHAMLFGKDSGWERAALALFPVDGDSLEFESVSAQTLRDTDLDAAKRAILEQMGVEYELPVPEDLTERAVARFGLAYPSTKDMGHFARELVGVTTDSADELLLAWIDTEEQVFRALERPIVGQKLEEGFASVDEFLSFSLSVQNRRKSRMGHALEHHLAELFDRAELRYEPQVRTEGNRTADFIFPGGLEYRDPGFPMEQLTVLAAKSTCKDRWPQVLADADRIPVKHLGTLDAALSGQQLKDMLSKQVVPVIPERIRRGYAVLPMSGEILSVGEFLELVAERAGADRVTS